MMRIPGPNMTRRSEKIGEDRPIGTHRNSSELIGSGLGSGRPKRTAVKSAASPKRRQVSAVFPLCRGGKVQKGNMKQFPPRLRNHTWLNLWQLNNISLVLYRQKGHVAFSPTPKIAKKNKTYVMTYLHFMKSTSESTAS